MRPVLLILMSVAACTRLWDEREVRAWWWWVLWLAPVATAAAFILVLVGGDVADQRVWGTLAMPAPFLWLVVLGIGTGAAVRGRWRATGLCVAFAASLSLIGSRGAGLVVMRGLESGMQNDWRDVRDLDAVAVLGGGTLPTAHGLVQLGPSGDRVVLPARMYHRGQTPILVTTGRSAVGGRDLTQETVAVWKDLGVPDDAIVVAPNAVNTLQEIGELDRLAKKHGWTKIGLVTSAWHLPRALAFADRVGLEMIPLAADSRGGIRQPHWTGFLVPRGQGFNDVEQAVREHVAGAVR